MLQRKFHSTQIFNHSDWLKTLSSQSKGLKKLGPGLKYRDEDGAHSSDVAESEAHGKHRNVNRPRVPGTNLNRGRVGKVVAFYMSW